LQTLFLCHFPAVIYGLQKIPYSRRTSAIYQHGTLEDTSANRFRQGAPFFEKKRVKKMTPTIQRGGVERKRVKTSPMILLADFNF